MPGLTSSRSPKCLKTSCSSATASLPACSSTNLSRGHQHRAFVSPAESDAISYADRVWRSPWLPAESRTGPLVFFALDLLFLNGVSTAELLLIKRKERLQRLFKKKSSGLRYSDNVGPRFSTKPRGLGLEGAISTQADRPYVPGDRGRGQPLARRVVYRAAC